MNVRGKSGDPARGSWCTPAWLAERLGEFDLDPCSNPRSHIRAKVALSLEDGRDGLIHVTLPNPSTRALKHPFAGIRTFINPPYDDGSVLRWLLAYEHTNFCFLLRFDPSTEWFRELYRRTALVCVPRRRVNFEPPPGVRASSNSIPHALYYRHAEDATPAILRACVAWRTGHGT